MVEYKVPTIEGLRVKSFLIYYLFFQVRELPTGSLLAKELRTIISDWYEELVEREKHNNLEP